MHTSTYSHTRFFLLFLNLSFYVSLTSSFSLSLSFSFQIFQIVQIKDREKRTTPSSLLSLASPRDVNRSYTDKLDLNLMR